MFLGEELTPLLSVSPFPCISSSSLPTLSFCEVPNGLSSSKNLLNAIPKSSKLTNPTIINADQTIKDGCIAIENINAVYL